VRLSVEAAEDKLEVVSGTSGKVTTCQTRGLDRGLPEQWGHSEPQTKLRQP